MQVCSVMAIQGRASTGSCPQATDSQGREETTTGQWVSEASIIRQESQCLELLFMSEGVSMHMRRWASRFKSESDPAASGESSNAGGRGRTGAGEKGEGVGRRSE